MAGWGLATVGAWTQVSFPGFPAADRRHGDRRGTRWGAQVSFARGWFLTGCGLARELRTSALLDFLLTF